MNTFPDKPSASVHMSLTILEWLYFSLPTVLAVGALVAGIVLCVPARRAPKPIRRRLLGGAFIGIFGLIVASMAYPCVYQSLGRHQELDFCAPQIVLAINPYVTFRGLVRRIG